MHTIRLLLWLKCKLSFRTYSRNVSAIIGVLLLLLLFLPISVGIALGVGTVFVTAKLAFSIKILLALLVGTYAFWILVPTLGYALNDTYDVTKLFIYPVSVPQLVIGFVAGSILDPFTLLLLPSLLAVVLGFSHTLISLLIILTACGLFLFHTLSLSQAIVQASAGFVRTRRFRDALAIVFPLVGIFYFVAIQRSMSHPEQFDFQHLLEGPFWSAMHFLPPGFAADAIAAAAEGRIAGALGNLVFLAIFTALTIFLSAWVIRKAFLGEAGVADSQRPEASREETKTEGKPGFLTPLLQRFPSTVQAIANKEFKYMLRDPFYKMMGMQFVYMFVAGMVMIENTLSLFQGALTNGILWGASSLLLMLETQLAGNIFGTEGGSISLLFLFPSSRRDLIQGKNLALFLILSSVNLLFVLTIALLARTFSLWASLYCWLELALIVLIALGNLSSILFPFRVVVRGWRMQYKSAAAGLTYVLFYFLLLIVSSIVLLPVLIGLLLPSFHVISSAWIVVILPLAFAYAIGIYYLSIYLAVPLLIQRETNLIAKVSQEE